MPQENQVLRCFSCKMFQVHLVKKEKKWQCKVCNNKQSVKKIYGRGSGKDCRLHVMKLNELQFSGKETDSYVIEDQDEHEKPDFVISPTEKTQLKSKWSVFMEEVRKDPDDESESCETDFKSENQDFYKAKRIKKNCFSPSENKKLSRVSERFESFGEVDKITAVNELGVNENIEYAHGSLKKQNESFHKNTVPRPQSKWLAYMSEKVKEESIHLDEKEGSGICVGEGNNPVQLTVEESCSSSNFREEIHEEKTVPHSTSSNSEITPSNLFEEISSKESKNLNCRNFSEVVQEPKLFSCAGGEKISIFQTPVNDEELDEILSL